MVLFMMERNQQKTARWTERLSWCNSMSARSGLVAAGLHPLFELHVSVRAFL